MAIATMLRIDDSGVAGNGVHLKVVVCYSDLPAPQPPDTRMIEFDIDLAASPTQLQTAFADAIRAAGVALGYSIPTNAVNVFNFSKG